VEKIRVSSKCGFLALASVLLLTVCFSGCGGTVSSSSTVSTTPSTMSIAISTAPPTTMAAGATATIASTVSNDSANAGVDWSCAPAGSCGTFNPAHTGSGATTTFTAPLTAGSVTITATSTSNHTVVVSVTIQVTGPTGTLAVALSGVPTTLAPGATASVSANVTNDAVNAGVDWTCTPAGSCGTFNPTHTASGAGTTFTAPPTGSVTIIATSTANNTVSASAPITISATTAGGSTLGAGSFAFSVVGEDSQKHTIAIMGSVALDSTGKVTSGEQDYLSHDGVLSPQPAGDVIAGGQLTISSGKGSLTLISPNTALGVNGTETFSVAVVNSKHAVIAEFDGAATSSGSIDLQTLPSPSTVAQLKGPFSFVVAGTDGPIVEAFGGSITFDGAGNLHVKVDQNAAGVITTGATHTNVGTYTAPDGAGRGSMTFGSENFSYYVVNPKVIRLAVTNANTPLTGSAYAGVTGASNASLKQKFVFADSSKLSSGATYAAAGFMTMDGNGNVSAGFADVDENGHATAAPFTGTYTVDSSGYGSITITPGNTQDISSLGLYLTDPTINFSDPNSPADAGLCGLILDLDTKLTGSGVLIVPPATAVNAPSGTFALDVQTSNTDNEADAVGVVAISGTTVTGTEDFNDLLKTLSATGQNAGIAVTGTLAADSANPGRFTLPLAVPVGTPAPTFNYVLYQASNTQIIVVEVDKQYGLGTLQQQH
jgi:hypothetical protein